MISTETKPRIYVACLASYNSGILHGAWFDASSDVDEMQAAINAVIESSPVPDAEEWAFHDYEGFGRLHEWQCLDSIAEMVEMYEQYGQGPVVAYCEHHDGWNESHFTESYQGVCRNYEWDRKCWLLTAFYDGIHLTGSELAFFEQYADDDKIAREMGWDYTFVDHHQKGVNGDGVAHIFRDC
jgi:antirestriction protein